MSASPELGSIAAHHLLEHVELAGRARPFLRAHAIDWNGLWHSPPWATREERVVRAAADLAGATGRHGLTPVTISELADPALWDPGPYSRTAEDHSHRVLEALAIRRGMSASAARRWLEARYDAIVRTLDVWEWGALPTDVDAPRQILSSRRLAARTESHLHFRSWPRIFESLAADRWAPDESLMIDSTLALSGGAGGPGLRELATGLDDEQLAAVVEGVYIHWHQGPGATAIGLSP